jgi:hypothetical protein
MSDPKKGTAQGSRGEKGRGRGGSERRGGKERRSRPSNERQRTTPVRSLDIRSQPVGLASEVRARSDDAVGSSLQIELGGRGDLLVGARRSVQAEELFRNYCMEKGNRCLVSE